MKYIITINQKAIIDLNAKYGFELNIFDALLLEFAYGWFPNSKATKIFHEGKQYVWIAHDLIKKNVPLLGMEKDAIYRRMAKLSKMGFFDLHPECKILGRTFYAPTALLDSIHYQTEGTVPKPNPYGSQTEPPTVLETNYNINNNNNENKYYEKVEKEVEQSPTPDPEKTTLVENVFEEAIEEKKPTAKTKCEQPAEEAKYFFEVSQILQEFEALMSVKFKIPETKKLFERYGQANKIIKVLQQGHSLEDCLNVIKLKHSEWFNDSKMRAYIVPDTIFAPNNFGKYLTQLQISNNNPQPQNNGNFNKQQQQQGSRFARSFAKHFAQDANNDVPF
jgi:uncharacterized phage protein (TIGR02220 family)